MLRRWLVLIAPVAVAILWLAARNYLLFVLDDDAMLRLNNVLRRGPGWKRDRAQPLAGGGLRDGDRDLNDPRLRHYRPAGAARAGNRQAEDTEGSRSGFH